MKVLAVGDIVGTAGINKLKQSLKQITEKEKVDFVIVNAENSAEGMGITEKNFKDITSLGVDCITMGNHTWGKKDIFKFIDSPKIIRPANYPEGVVGKGYNIYTCKGKKIAVMNLIGRVDINILTENPFLEAKKIIEKIQNEADMIFIDFHAEATAEKIALGYYLDGKVTAIFGTHTHVQTADERIIDKKVAFISDVGMTGPYLSSLGCDLDSVITRMRGLSSKFLISENSGQFAGVVIEFNDKHQPISIERVLINDDHLYRAS